MHRRAQDSLQEHVYLCSTDSSGWVTIPAILQKDDASRLDLHPSDQNFALVPLGERSDCRAYAVVPAQESWAQLELRGEISLPALVRVEAFQPNVTGQIVAYWKWLWDVGYNAIPNPVGSVGVAPRRGPHIAYILAPGMAATVAHPLAPHARLPVDLHREALVSGRVIDPAGAPLAGATLNLLVAKTRDGVHHRADTVIAEDSGEFLLPHLPEGVLQLEASHRGRRVFFECSLSEGSRRQNVNLTLPPGRPLIVHVSSHGGKPVPGATVLLIPGDHFLHSIAWPALHLEANETGDDGRLIVEGLSADIPWMIAAWSPGLGQAVACVDAGAGTPGSTELVLQEGGQLVIFVVDKLGRAVSGCLIRAEAYVGAGSPCEFVQRSSDGAIRGFRIESDVKGIVSFEDLPTGDYAITVDSDRWRQVESDLSFRIEGGRRVEAQLTLSSLKEVRVECLRGKEPLAFAAVWGSLLDTDHGQVVERINSRITEGNGSFVLRLPPGEYLLDGFTAEGHLKSLSPVPFSVSDEEAAPLVQLYFGSASSRDLRVRVVDSRGYPVKGIQVANRKPPFLRNRGVTDDEGQTVLKDLDSGRHEIWAQNGMCQMMVSAQLPEDAADGVKIVLPPTGNLLLRLRDPLGRPAASRTVWPASNLREALGDFAMAVSRSDGEGRLEFIGLPAGQYTFPTAFAYSELQEPLDITIHDGDKIEREAWVKGSGTLEVVLAGDGPFPPGVSLFLESGSFVSRIEAAGSMGVYRREGVQAGVWTLRAGLHGGPTFGPAIIELATGHTVRVSLGEDTSRGSLFVSAVGTVISGELSFAIRPMDWPGATEVLRAHWPQATFHNLEPGRYRVAATERTVADSVVLADGCGMEVDVRAGAMSSVVVPLPSVAVSLVLRDADGVDSPSGKVRILPGSREVPERTIHYLAGRGRFLAPPGSEFALRVIPSRAVGWVEFGPFIANGDGDPLLLVLPVPEPHVLVVQHADGTPGAGTAVYSSVGDGVWQMQRTDPLGRLELLGLGNPCRILAVASGGSVASCDLGPWAREEELVLSKGICLALPDEVASLPILDEGGYVLPEILKSDGSGGRRYGPVPQGRYFALRSDGARVELSAEGP